MILGRVGWVEKPIVVGAGKVAEGPSVTPLAPSSPEGWRATEERKQQVLKPNPAPEPQHRKSVWSQTSY